MLVLGFSPHKLLSATTPHLANGAGETWDRNPEESYYQSEDSRGLSFSSLIETERKEMWTLDEEFYPKVCGHSLFPFIISTGSLSFGKDSWGSCWNLLKNHSYCCYVTSVMSDSMRPHRRQPTRLRHPWDSPGKNTGGGCHFLLQCMKMKSESEVAQSCPTLCDPTDRSLPGSSIHGIFQARVLEWSAIAFSVKTRD